MAAESRVMRPHNNLTHATATQTNAQGEAVGRLGQPWYHQMLRGGPSNFLCVHASFGETRLKVAGLSEQ
eukprot:scaffold7915_cov86-Skeletonema_marinoi.AAC.1